MATEIFEGVLQRITIVGAPKKSAIFAVGFNDNLRNLKP
jgi:hypothetical protein